MYGFMKKIPRVRKFTILIQNMNNTLQDTRNR